ncbi:TraR/DksA C4-type zinc finger protein [Photobacterium arenosum]|uniref:TraR/DksA C4-type zinc finger protein n=1 Tax=Photobacterium arenosum TaxID=2774143 RepID=UPI00288A525E|nr:TraR/DksA C4-type zinc finger protein [Photobacterium arenosum]
MTDVCDRAAETSELFWQAALSTHQKKPAEQPDQDENGNRYCLSCGVLIPPQRVAVVPDCVRCIDCQQLKETQR